MPKLHKYVPSSSKEGFYIYAMHNGQNVTYQVTPIARRIFDKLGYGDNTEITGEMLYTLHRLHLIYTNKSGVEPPTSFDEISDKIEKPNSAKGDRKRFFNTLLEEGSFDHDQQKDLDQYLKTQNIETVPSENNPPPSSTGEWRPTTPTSGDVYHGTVDFFNDTGGYGFIDSPDFEDDVFYHMEELGGRDIAEGTKLEFVRKETEKGPRTTHVRLLDEDQPLEVPKDEDTELGSLKLPSKEVLDGRPPLKAFQEAKGYSAELEVTFLGTGGHWPTKKRSPNSVLIKRDSETFLFDVGEGTQRQMHRYRTGFGFDEIFLTSTEVDHIGGLGPLLATLSLQNRNKPLHIYVPESGEETVESHVELYGEFDYPLDIKPVTDGVVYEANTYTIKAFNTDEDGQKKGYVIEEAPKRGQFDRSRAEDLGVAPGPDFTRLCNGETVTTDDGREVDPRLVVGDPTPGRHLVYTGVVSDAGEIPSVAQEADLLIHEAAYLYSQSDRAEVTDHATGKLAGHAAEKANVDQLVLTSIAPRTEQQTKPLVKEAKREFSGDVKLASDGGSLSLPVPESADPPSEPSSSTSTSSIKIGDTVSHGSLEEGMYVQVEVDRTQSSGKGLTKNGHIHIMDGSSHVGEKRIVRISSVKSGYAIAEVEKPSSGRTVYQYNPNKPKSKKRSRRSPRKKSSGSQRKSTSQKRKKGMSNPFRSRSNKMKDLVRKKH